MRLFLEERLSVSACVCVRGGGGRMNFYVDG